MERESLRGLWKRCITCVFVQNFGFVSQPTYFQNFKAKIHFWDLGFSKPFLNDVREVTGSGKDKNRVEKPRKINFLPISLL